MHLTTFLCGPASPATRSTLDNLPELPATAARACLLYCTTPRVRSTLALHYAFSCVGGDDAAAAAAADGGSHAVILCKRDSVEQAPPALPEGVEANDPRLQRIRLKYVQSLQAVQEYAACLHMSDEAPSAVVLDDVSAFTDGLDDRRTKESLVRTLALLVDAVQALRPASGKPCTLLVTDSGAEEGPRSLRFVLSRWLRAMLHVTGSPKQYTLSVMPTSGDADILDTRLLTTGVQFSVSGEGGAAGSGRLVIDGVVTIPPAPSSLQGQQQQGQQQQGQQQQQQQGGNVVRAGGTYRSWNPPRSTGLPQRA